MPAACLVQHCAGETHCTIPSGNGMGRGQGKAAPGLGDMGQCEAIALPCLPQLLRAKVEVLGQALVTRHQPETSPSLSQRLQFKPYTAFQSRRRWYGQARSSVPNSFCRTWEADSHNLTGKDKKVKGTFYTHMGMGSPILRGPGPGLCYLSGPCRVDGGYELAGASIRGGDVLAAVWLMGVLVLYFEDKVGHGPWDRLQGASGHCRPRQSCLASPWQPSACEGLRWACGLPATLRGLWGDLWRFNIYYPLWLIFWVVSAL